MILSIPAYELAGKLLDLWLGDRTEVMLADAARNLDRQIQDAQDKGEAEVCFLAAVRRANGQRLISGLLRRRGFKKVGMVGSGYDREPLYRKEPADAAAAA